MASQTEAPDDLIAELARLMADDARPDQPVRNQPAPQSTPAPVRIPGSDAADKAAHPSSPVRIPGAAPAAEPEIAPEPFAFDFGLDRPERKKEPEVELSFGDEKPPVAPQPAARVETPAPADPVQDANESLDYDGLADLIAAELASDLAPEDPLPTVEGPARGDDNFGVAPVFGLGSSAPEPELAREPVIDTPTISFEPPKPELPRAAEPQFEAPQPAPVAAAASQPPRQSSDPLDDIERFLGPVVHKTSDQAEPVRSPSPALRSLATPTLPAAEPAVPREPAARHDDSISVDDAILAAAAATGARVEWVNSDRVPPPADAEDFAGEDERPRRRFTMSRAVAGPLVAIGLLGIAGFGLYWVLGQGGTPSGPAPLLVADTTAVKDVPAPAETSAPQSVVFNEISGAGNSADEQLVPRDQADEAALNEVTASTPGSGTLTGVDGTGVDPNQDGLVNRKVRTVTVRPDGTIISGTESVAGSSILPVERPNVPEVPGADTSTPDLIASTIANETPPAAVPETTPVPGVTPVASGAVVPVVDAAGNALQGRTVTVPVERPADFAQAAASALASASVPASTPAPAAQPTAQPAAQPAAATPAVTPSAGNAGAYVQLASQRSEDAARQSAQSMNTRYGVLFGGAAPEIQRVDLGERGIYYRVLVPAASRDAAANICTNIKAAGGDCLLL